MRAAVVGHLEWVEFIRVDRLPQVGDIVHAGEWWEEPGGGGPGAAEQLRKLGADTIFFTAFGDDEFGHRAHDDLTRRGLRVEAVFRPEATRRAVTQIDNDGERTITVLGERLAPSLDEPLAWHLLQEMDCVYFTAGDESALTEARKARVLVATSRALDVVRKTSVQLDALVGSSNDPSELHERDELDPVPRLSVWTNGAEGGRFTVGAGPMSRYNPAPLPGRVGDRYGAGDSFAAGLTWGLGSNMEVDDALKLAARCGAAVVAGRGPYETQLEDP